MTHRRILPNKRESETFHLTHGNLNSVFSVTLGFFDDGAVGEVFVSGAKAGSEVDGLARDCAVLVSLSLQYGVPVETMKGTITREASGQPTTIIGKVVDLIAGNTRLRVIDGG